MSNSEPRILSLEPIGYVQSGKQLKFETPHQPDSGSTETNRIVLLPGKQFELALQDLVGFERIWLVWWFDRNTTWRPRALPPRGPAKRRGVFATRSPHRPNPIGLTCVPLLAVDGLNLTVGPIDLVDGTPILDIKPYISTVDAFPDSSLGWIGEMEAELAAAEKYEIQVSDLAGRQLKWLQERWNIDFRDRAFSILQVDPRPHRTRRILQMGENHFRLACGPWRLFFSVHGQAVVIESVGNGYSEESLVDPNKAELPEREAQIEFAMVPWKKGPLGG